MEQWGFVTPKTRTHPASHATFMAHVSYGRIGVQPGVTSVAGKTVTFVDGTELEVDTIIAATGYHIDLPFLRSVDRAGAANAGSRPTVGSCTPTVPACTSSASSTSAAVPTSR